MAIKLNHTIVHSRDPRASADFLTRLKNASCAAKADMTVPFSQIKAEIARILQEEGYVWGYEVEQNDGKPRIKVRLKYEGRTPAIMSRLASSTFVPSIDSTETLWSPSRVTSARLPSGVKAT